MSVLRPVACLCLLSIAVNSTVLAQFGAEQMIALEGPETIELMDMDNDGDRDLLVGSRLGILLFTNTDGLGTFDLGTLIGTGLESRAHAVDMDGNGLLDIIASRDLNGGLMWFRNLGNLGWSTPFDILSGASAQSLGAADLDNDGDNDPFFVLSINSLAWCENTDGNGTTSAAMSITPVFNSAAVQAADLDEDGDTDLAWSVRVPEETGWCQNLGNSTFSGAQSVTSDRRGKFADMDGDGRLDLLSASTLAGVVDWQRGLNAQLGFTPSFPVALGAFPSQFSVTDLDGDGDRDVALADAASDQLGWYENLDGQGGFGTLQTIAYGVEDAHTIAAADLNGDGDPEFFAASSAQNRVVWYENLHTAQLMIVGRVFNDVNADGQFNGNDYGVYNVMVDLSDGRSTFTNHSGIYWFTAAPGAYVLDVMEPYQWQFTGPASQTAMVSAPNGSALHRDFAIAPDQVLDVCMPQLASGTITCSQEIPYFISATNTGNTMRDLRMVLQLDAISSFVSADPMPTSVNGNTLTWEFANLQPSHARSVEVRMLSADASYLGTVMNDLLTTELLNNGQVVHSADFGYAPVLMCAYDPNDKQVLPVGDGVDHMTAMNSTLQYTVRFMNTGNAPATNVVIVDELDENIDPSTVQVLASSHTVHTVVEANGLVRFEHMGINLPDSGSTWAGSQGFVRFSARPLGGLAEGTVVSNTADIHFDNNPAIVTNTVFNTLTYGIVDAVAETLPQEHFLTIVPNPVVDQTIITVEASFDVAADLQLTDAGGRVVRRWKVRSKEQVAVNMAGTPSGMYALQLAEPGGAAHVTRMVIE